MEFQKNTSYRNFLFWNQAILKQKKKLHLQGQGNSRAASLGEGPGHGHDASPPELMTGNVPVLEYKNH